MCSAPHTSARAIVVQMHAHDREVADQRQPVDRWRLTLTVMPEGAPPFRCRVTTDLPRDASWGVHVGSHVSVRMAADSSAVTLDVDALAAGGGERSADG